MLKKVENSEIVTRSTCCVKTIKCLKENKHPESRVKDSEMRKHSASNMDQTFYVNKINFFQHLNVKYKMIMNNTNHLLTGSPELWTSTRSWIIQYQKISEPEEFISSS